MARWFGGNCEEYIAQLEKLNADTDKVIAKAVYDGAGAVAEVFRGAIQSLDCSDEDRRGMSNGLTIFRHTKEDGVRSTRLGIAGNNGKPTKYFRGGVPYSYIAHSINTGTSKRTAQPWISKATRQAKPKAESAMEKAIETEISNLIK